MKALDAESSIESINSLIERVKEQQDQLSAVEGWLHFESINLKLEAKFQGVASMRIINYFTHCHLPFVRLLKTILSDFASTLEDSLNKLQTNFEPNEFIREAFLQDEINQQIESLKSTMIGLGEEVTNVTRLYEDVVHLRPFDYDSVIDGLTNSSSKVDETIEKIHQFDYEQLTPMQFVGEDITMLQSYVSRLEDMFVSGSISIMGFSTGMIKDEKVFVEMKQTYNRREVDQFFSVTGDLSTTFGYFDAAAPNLLAASSLAFGTYGDYLRAGGKGVSTTPTQSVPRTSLTPQDVQNARDIQRNGTASTSSTPTANTPTPQSKVYQTGQKVTRTISNVVYSPYTRAAGPVGWGLTVAGNASEFTKSENRNKSFDEKAIRFGTGTVVEGGSAIAGTLTGAAAGAAIGSVVPVVGTVIGGAVGGFVGGVGGVTVGMKVSDQAKDLAESGLNYTKDLSKSITSSVKNWFK